ncbi:MAG: hypothetical protein A2Z83_04140 [Omnitrophica bacterium GWA2_52_8]|nr:MAG: hypothetical protein A2Z83_04140 [Omnitrophica bacterium GWA2_52_8]
MGFVSKIFLINVPAPSRAPDFPRINSKPKMEPRGQSLRKSCVPAAGKIRYRTAAFILLMIA